MAKVYDNKHSHKYMVDNKGKTEWTAKELEQIDSYSILSIIVEVL